eukprot:7671935-Ditylum_brightwellii.AAC.1
MWRLYIGVHEGYMVDPVPPPSHKVSTNLGDEPTHLIEGSKIVKYWTNHYTIPEDACKWATKWAAEKLPTSSEMEDRKACDNTICLHKYSEELEDPEHIILYSKANCLWRKSNKYYSCGMQASSALICCNRAFFSHRTHVEGKNISPQTIWRNHNSHQATYTSAS